MAKRPINLTRLSPMERSTLFRFIAFPESFSIDWFSDIDEVRPSQLVSVISYLEHHHWISPVRDTGGLYRWTKTFPRDDLASMVPEKEMAKHYRQAANLLMKHLPATDENTLRIATACLLAGIEEGDQDIILKAALHEEAHHRIASAIRLYDRLLGFMETLVTGRDGLTSPGTFRTMMTALERRATLSLLHPNLKRIKPWLLMAKDAATRLEDVRSRASVELLIGQYCWMSFQYEQAVSHFETAWGMIEKIDDRDLHKRGLQLRGLSFLIRGDLSKAVQSYEESIGELEQIADDDFSLITALHLSQCYTQLGMPQRALGISETIHNEAKKHGNWPLVCFALANAGLILIEMMHIKESRAYFEMALDICRKEATPMAEIIAGVGLANIECIEGRFDKAAEHFKVLFRIRKSSWYHTLNACHIFEPGFILHRRGDSPMALDSVIHFLGEFKEEQLNPLVYGTIRRLKIKYLEKDVKPKDKVKEIEDIEASLEKIGALFELAKTRIDLARLHLQMNHWPQAEAAARKAWEFMKRAARPAFPPDLKPLIRSEDETAEDRLFDVIIEMGDALTTQKNTEHLLTNIITSISRLTGAERAAIFIRDKKSPDIRIVASRNLLKEHMADPDFREIREVIRLAAAGGESRIVQREKDTETGREVRKMIITPLLLGKRVTGVLYQDSRFFAIDLSPDRLRLLSALASQIAVSIDRAQAHDEIASLNDRLIAENRYYQEEKEEFRPFGDIIGSSDVMLNLLNLIHKVAPTKSTVLIKGETGVGKELIARAIHRESARRNGPFIRVNCAALPDTLIDSELFGHEKGAFTGASRMKPGRFELANSGTIFLDEVSELPPSTQSRLLRILQEKEFQRVGGTKTLFSDFRLIAATNKDLEREVQDGRYRSDLFFRLNVFPIRVPPLRERKDDIAPLARHFLKLFCAQYNRPYPTIPPEEMERLVSYAWPGNVRELANVIERAVILGDPDVRFPETLETGVRFHGDDPLMNLKDLERTHILNALKVTRGKVGGADGASALLGLKRTTLIHRMKKLGISLQKNAGVKA
jgi:transcriptional regulator with GAF, ATPase, and Fis domain/tetratricopeptide (TPR) repeat protein